MSSIVKPCDYNIDNLTFAPLSNTKKKSLQSILLPSYNGGRSPMIQLPPIDLDMYGIPSKCDFYKEDWQRMFLKLPLNQKNTEAKELTEGFLKNLDATLGSDKFKETVLGGKKAMKYTYQPIVRTPIGEDGNPNPDKHPYMKMKLLTEFPSNVIRTAVVEQTDDGGRFLKTDTETIDDIVKYFHLQTNLRCMIAPVKIWIHQSNANEATYGLTFKLIKVMVKIPLTRALKHQDESMVDFLDSDSD